MNRTAKIKQNKILLFSLLIITTLLLSGCTSSDITEANNDQGTENQNAIDPNNDDNSNQYTANLDPRFIGNWTWAGSSSGDEQINDISNGWLNFEADGTWDFYYDYGYTERIQNGTWQAKDGDLYWGTEGYEISDWYAYDNYKFEDGDLIIIQSGGESRYQKQ